MPESAMRKILVWLGPRSYSIYLLQPTVFYATRQFWLRSLAGAPLSGVYMLRFTVIATVLIIVLAEANFRFVEEPLRKYGKARAKRFLLQGIPPKVSPTAE
jgi:peptidoglycan/LPS O-acetylase OafA/YrhL